MEAGSELGGAGAGQSGDAPPAHQATPPLPRSYGYDPLGLGKDAEQVAKYRVNELLHARWAMLAAAGILIPEGLQVAIGRGARPGGPGIAGKWGDMGGGCTADAARPIACNVLVDRVRRPTAPALLAAPGSRLARRCSTAAP